MREDARREFKERVSSTFLKTVSAYANYGTGEILFGISDSGDVVGLRDLDGAALSIENAINDSVQPRPRFELEKNPHTRVLTLRVFEGVDKPYFYRSKAFKRSDTSTVQVDSLELKRLVLEGENRTFDSLPASGDDFSFTALSSALENEVSVQTFGEDTLRTLGLLSPTQQYTNAGALLADVNEFPGIDIARFGADINTILDRSVLEHQSVLTQLSGALEMFDRYYTYEQIIGFKREAKEAIPRNAFREIIANALVHRTWDVSAHIRVAMFEDRVEVTSPGGLVHGVTEKDYLSGNLSILRNPVLGNVLFRLNIIEQFGTGIRRVLHSYDGAAVTPRFEVSESAIKVVLPCIDVAVPADAAEEAVLSLFVPGALLSTSDVARATGFGKDKSLKTLQHLVFKGLVTVQGTGRGTRYKKTGR